jgi:hypothetical protein
MKIQYAGLILAMVCSVRTAEIAVAQPQLPPPPKGFDSPRDKIEHGKVETVEYDSKTVGAKRKMVVYSPPGYDASKKYPVLYLLHGAKYSEISWTKEGGAANVILDNLYADKKLTSMVVVMPNGHVQAAGAKAKNGSGFESELLNDVMPTAESRFSIQKDACHPGQNQSCAQRGKCQKNQASVFIVWRRRFVFWDDHELSHVAGKGESRALLERRARRGAQLWDVES